MNQMKQYDTPESRWAGVGPYYAMFPSAFADTVVEAYSQPGDAVLDPFAGRGTAIFSAATKNRPAIGIEISPLGYVYANAKLKPSNCQRILQRLEELAEITPLYNRDADNLPRFFHHCFSRQVRTFLLAARHELDWRHNKADRALMAIILVYLHGKRASSLSNQMRQTTSMAPDYSVRWWTEKELSPPDIDPVTFFTKRINWRYAKGTPQTECSSVLLGDSTRNLPRLARDIKECRRPKAKLLFTSPPYRNVTNYYYDQWLRLWLLGEPEHPRENAYRYGGKFSNSDRYRLLLQKVFSKAKKTLATDAVVYVRTDKRESTFNSTRDILSEIFPEKNIRKKYQPLSTELRPKSYSRGGAPKEENCEVDLILEPR